MALSPLCFTGRAGFSAKEEQRPWVLMNPVVGNSEVKKLGDRVRELKCMLGRKTMEVELLRDALSKAGPKTDIAGDLVAEGRWSMKTVADVLNVSRSNRAVRLKGRSKSRGSYLKVEDAKLLPAMRRGSRKLGK